MLRVIVVAVLALPLAGCMEWFYGQTYDQTPSGKLSGKLVVEWIDQDKFVFLPDERDPLVFTRSSGEKIQPQSMFTDGGSIPRALRAVKSYSPWGYAPAFIVHDWLFVMNHCKISGHEKYDVEKAAQVMAEVMKTVMENPKFGGPNKLVLYSMYEAVKSPVAKGYWENGKCDTPSGKRIMPQARSRSIRSRSLTQTETKSAPVRPRFEISF
ncbi:MAG: DUF1353 domain-containing protein [Pseudomonadota bacterium]